MLDTVRDAPFGHILRFVSRGRWLKFPEEQEGFVVPEAYTGAAKHVEVEVKKTGEVAAITEVEGEKPLRHVDTSATLAGSALSDRSDSTVADPRVTTSPTGPTGPPQYIIVDWYGPDDPANPQNWSLGKKAWVTFVVCAYTAFIYIGSAIFAYAIHDVSVEMGVSETLATLLLTMFVLGYAVGPLFLSPISEIAAIGRNPPYTISLIIFCILQIPTGLTNSFAGLLVLRFIAGFAGSPPLATAGASITDIYSEQKSGYAISLYGLAAGVAPAIAPTISGFAVQRFGWRWAAWELLLISGVGLLLLFFGLPETFADNILYRRAARLRALTGNQSLRSISEIADAEKSFGAIMKEALIRPLEMTFVEPIVIAINLYLGLIYAILYSYFESFPWVFARGYPGAYGWSLGVAGLPFLALTIGAIISYIIYCIWAYRVWEPQYVAAKGKLAPEAYLPLAQWGAFCYPICLFWFAWSAGRTHWISPVLASAVFGLGDCWSFMPFLSYLCVAYPKYVASAQASNDFVRSIMGAAMPIVARPLFTNLGIAWGNSLLAFLTLAFVPIPFVLIRYGPWLRRHSRMATKYATGLDEDDTEEKESRA